MAEVTGAIPNDNIWGNVLSATQDLAGGKTALSTRCACKKFNACRKDIRQYMIMKNYVPANIYPYSSLTQICTRYLALLPCKLHQFVYYNKITLLLFFICNKSNTIGRHNISTKHKP